MNYLALILFTVILGTIIGHLLISLMYRLLHKG